MGAIFSIPNVFSKKNIDDEVQRIYTSLVDAIVEQDRPRIVRIVRSWNAMRPYVPEDMCKRVDDMIYSISGVEEPLLPYE
jgi:hypothetical protein